MRMTVVSVTFLIAMALPATPQRAPEPLKKEQVTALVKAGMETQALAKLIREHGIDFDLTDDYVQTLRAAKAQEPVIQALRAARPQALTKEKLLELVAGGVSGQRAADLVSHRGVTFIADDEYLKTLRLAGADEALVNAVSKASAARATSLVVVTSPGADVYLDNDLAGHANLQGELAVKTASGPHTLRVTQEGKKDFQQDLTLAAHETPRIEAQLERAGPAPAATVQFPFPAVSGVPPLTKETQEKSQECMTLANIWNSKLQQAMSTRDFSHRGQMASQINDVNSERAATYRSKLLPQLQDLQKKLLTELGRTSSEHLDYSMVSTPLQLIGVCNDVSMLGVNYQQKKLQANVK